MKREPPTPWNPSRGATKRVTNPQPVPTHCRHCGASCSIVSNAAIHGGSGSGEWPWCVLCSGCGAWVALHPFTGIPIGTLATPAIHEARRHAKAALNPLWKTQAMGRKDAHAWLAVAMGIDNVDECQIGLFDVADCNRVVILVGAWWAQRERDTGHKAPAEIALPNLR